MRLIRTSQINKAPARSPTRAPFMLRDFPTTAAAVNWEGAAEAPVSEEALPELWLLEGDGVVVAVAGPEAPPLPAEALPFSAPAPPVAVCAGERTTVPGVR